ncbi:Peptidyl-prolyl cis-trans isomerase cyp6 [Gonapodya sp. JEL0774]|nr:Peptidyl-prolyl cis-trans isomerase cyp6 [Gonapodya sp. JEL0774]
MVAEMGRVEQDEDEDDPAFAPHAGYYNAHGVKTGKVVELAKPRITGVRDTVLREVERMHAEPDEVPGYAEAWGWSGDSETPLAPKPISAIGSATRLTHLADVPGGEMFFRRTEDVGYALKIATERGNTPLGRNLIHGESRRHFVPEMPPKLKHKKRGVVSFACVIPPADPNSSVQPVPLAASQFFITLGAQLTDLDGKHAPFGVVAEGLEVLEKFNDALVDDNGRPYIDIRIRHTIIIDDPFPDMEGLRVPEGSPEPTEEMLKSTRLSDTDALKPTLPPEEEELAHQRHEASARALTLEMLGDLPFAEIKPPENVLFVCKLNPVTRDEDLELIFSRFGTIRSCEILRDKKSGDSLQYAFIEFDEREACERAYFKMDNVLIDDRRIHVDFSQSVGKLHKEWMYARQQKGRGITELQKKTRYREEEDTADQYDMVFEGQDGEERKAAGGGKFSGSGAHQSDRKPDLQAVRSDGNVVQRHLKRTECRLGFRDLNISEIPTSATRRRASEPLIVTSTQWRSDSGLSISQGNLITAQSPEGTQNPQFLQWQSGPVDPMVRSENFYSNPASNEWAINAPQEFPATINIPFTGQPFLRTRELPISPTSSFASLPSMSASEDVISSRHGGHHTSSDTFRSSMFTHAEMSSWKHFIQANLPPAPFLEPDPAPVPEVPTIPISL